MGEQMLERGALPGMQPISAWSIRKINTLNGRPVLRGRLNCFAAVYRDGFPVPSDDADDAVKY